jgi:hypothetical protein
MESPFFPSLISPIFELAIQIIEISKRGRRFAAGNIQHTVELYGLKDWNLLI